MMDHQHEFATSGHFRRAKNIKSTVLAAAAVLVACLFLGSSSAQAISTLTGCQCTDYAYQQRPDLPRGMGSPFGIEAKYWIKGADRRGIPWSHTPYVDDVAVFQPGIHGAGSDGHVAIVTWVNSDRTRFGVAEWNFANGICITTYRSNLTVVDGVDFIHKEGTAPSPSPDTGPRPSRGEISVDPVSPAQVGATVKIQARVVPGDNFRSARLLIDKSVVYELAGTDLRYTWNTSGNVPGTHSIRLEMASRDDTSWVTPDVEELIYVLESAPPPPNRSPFEPTLLSPESGASVLNGATFCWRNKGDPDGDETQTRVEIWEGGTWVSPWLNDVEPCWTAPGLSVGEHSWSARARDVHGAQSGATEPWYLEVGMPTPTKTAGVQLTVSPGNTRSGEDVTVTWSGLSPTGNDWVSLHPSGAPDSTYLSWEFVKGSSGSISFSTPSNTGDFAFRLFRNGEKVAESNRLHVEGQQANCAAPPIQDLSLTPGSSARVGDTVTIHASASSGPCFRSMRLKIDGRVVYELGSPEWDYTWATREYGTGSHTIRLEVAGQSDSSWDQPAVREVNYNLRPAATAVPQPCQAPEIETLSFNPASPSTVGGSITIHAKSATNSCFRSMRLKIDGGIVYELGSPEFTFGWNTNGYSTGGHTIRLEVAAQGDNSWSNPSIQESSYTLQSGTPPTTPPCQAPPIEDLSFNPGSPSQVGTTVSVHSKATRNSCFRSMRLKIDGGIVYELGSPEFTFIWNTSSYSAGSHTIRLEVAAQGDNSWSNPSAQKTTYDLQSNTPPTSPPPSLGKPSLVSPSNGALLPPGTDVTLEWSPVSGATQYIVEIWGGQYGGTHTTPCGWQDGTSCHIGTMSPGNVLWRVQARDGSGNLSPWGDEWNFTPQ